MNKHSTLKDLYQRVRFGIDTAKSKLEVFALKREAAIVGGSLGAVVLGVLSASPSDAGSNDAFNQPVSYCNIALDKYINFPTDLEDQRLTTQIRVSKVPCPQDEYTIGYKEYIQYIINKTGFGPKVIGGNIVYFVNLKSNLEPTNKNYSILVLKKPDDTGVLLLNDETNDNMGDSVDAVFTVVGQHGFMRENTYKSHITDEEKQRFEEWTKVYNKYLKEMKVTKDFSPSDF